jgi:mannose-1-phosphate guanylyltransferase
MPVPLPRLPRHSHPVVRTKAVILVGGPKDGTQFRPLHADTRPKPLFPVAGFPMIYHTIDACARSGVSEILLLGTFESQLMNDFLLSRAVEKLKREQQVAISYLPEGATPLGTAGGIYKFRGQIEDGGIDCFFVINSDVCAEFPLAAMVKHHSMVGDGNHLTIMSVKARKEQAVNYGNLLVAHDNTLVQHYQEKSQNPESMGNFAEINGGVYVLSPGVFTVMNKIVTENYKMNVANPDSIGLEQDVFPRLAGSQLYAFRTANFWSQIKTAGSAIYANRHYLGSYRSSAGARSNAMLATGANIVGDVWIHESAVVHASAKLGPNVSIGAGVKIGAGARVRDSLLLDSVSLGAHCVVLNAIIDRGSAIGAWGRVEGSAVGVNPNDPTTHMPPKPLFSGDGRLNPLVTIVGEETKVAEGVMVLSVICMPHKELGAMKYANQIIL